MASPTEAASAVVLLKDEGFLLQMSLTMVGEGAKDNGLSFAAVASRVASFEY